MIAKREERFVSGVSFTNGGTSRKLSENKATVLFWALRDAKDLAEAKVVCDRLESVLRDLNLSALDSTRERVDLVDQHYQKVGSKKKAAKIMELSISTYYADPKVGRAEKEEQEVDLRGKIEQIQVEFPRAGYRMLLHHLKRTGVDIGERRLRGVLSRFDLQVKPLKRFVKTTDSDHNHEVHPNLIEEMTITGINQVWASDMTYIRIRNGFVYLAVILDLYSRKVIGWAISRRIDGQVTVDALNMAIERRSPPRGTIHHSDRGVQYLCGAYTN